MTRHKLDVERIISVLSQRGYEVSFAQAFNAWSDYSESMSAGWLSLPEDDKLLFDLTYKFLHWFTPGRCVGDTWISLLDKYEHLIGSKYKDKKNKTWIFMGLLHGEDDFYFVLNLVGSDICRLASCVGSLEMDDFKLHEAVVRDDDG